MEKPSMLTFFFTLFLLSLCTTVTSLTKIVFFTGKDITLTCDLPIEKTSTIIWRDWMFNEAHEPHELFSSLNPTIVDKRITISNDYKQITFKSMLKSGEVSCVVKTNDQVDLKKFHITAIETNPKCEGSEEYDEGQPLNNKCGVVTDGSVSLITHPAVKSVDVDSFDEVAIRLDEPASQKLDGVKVECRAQNLSDFSCSWTFNVKYKVRDLKGPEKETYSVGEVISCSAMGNPIPKLEMKLNGKEVIKENGKKIDYKLGDELLEKKYVLVDCLASNPYENLRQSYNFTLTKPKHVSPGEVLLENKNWILILIVILIAVVLLLLIIIFLCWRKRKNSKNTHSKENSAQLMSKKDYPNEATA